MTYAADCPQGGPTRDNGNCWELGDDELQVQCVGRWALEKHDVLQRYITATHGARRQFLDGGGGAGYVDLFAGPGKCRVRDSGEIVGGSPSIAASHALSPFTKIVLGEMDEDNRTALSARFQSDPRVVLVAGDSNENIDKIVAQAPPRGLNLAFIDPFSATDLVFESLRRLASVERMDMIINFPIGEMRRNWKHPERIDRAVGSDDASLRVASPRDVIKTLAQLQSNLARLGYTELPRRTVPVENDNGVTLYHLTYASKHPLGDKIWASITSRDPNGQRRLL